MRCGAPARRRHRPVKLSQRRVWMREPRRGRRGMWRRRRARGSVHAGYVRECLSGGVLVQLVHAACLRRSHFVILALLPFANEARPVAEAPSVALHARRGPGTARGAL